MEAEIKIYQSCWKNLWLILGCMLFTVGGIYMITDESCRLVNKIIGGWLGVIFFGGGGLWLAVTTFYNAVKRIPYLVIYEDRVEQYVQWKAARYTIYFADVQRFRLIKISSSKQIAIDYKRTHFLKKMKSKTTSGIVKKLMTFNFLVSGAIESIYVSNLSMKGEDICRLLNDRTNPKRNHPEYTVWKQAVGHKKIDAQLAAHLLSFQSSIFFINSFPWQRLVEVGYT